MIFDALNDLYNSLSSDPNNQKLPKQGWQSERISYALSLNKDGTLMGIQTLIEDKKSKPMVVPEKGVRAAGVKASFLSDNSQYLLGLSKKEDKRTIECFYASKNLHMSILQDIDNPIALAVYNFFDNWNPDENNENEIIQEYQDNITTGNIVFNYLGDYAHEDSEIIKAWDEYYLKESGGNPVLCFDSGKMEPAKLIHGKIKGVIGGHTAGTALVSFQKGSTAYESYGKKDEQGLTAPISDKTAFAYVTTLNYLLSDKDHHKVLGGQSIVYWGEEISDKVMAFGLVPEKKEDPYINNIINKISKGELPDKVNSDKRYNVAILKANAARLSVSFYWQDTVEHFLGNIKKHYNDLEIDRPPYEREHLTVWDLLNAVKTPKGKSSNIPESMWSKVIESIITGTDYPSSLFYSVMKRIKADRNITRTRVAIIKAYLTRNMQSKKGVTLKVTLDLNEKAPAYVLGRLFSILENVQEKAHADGKIESGLNRTIKDRFFTLASTTPLAAFPRLMRLKDIYIKKLKRSEKGRGNARYFEKEIGELMDKLDPSDIYPKRFSVEEQGLFIGGYYHQTQKRFEKKKVDNKTTENADVE